MSENIPPGQEFIVGNIRRREDGIEIYRLYMEIVDFATNETGHMGVSMKGGLAKRDRMVVALVAAGATIQTRGA